MFGAFRPYIPWLATTALALGLIFSNRNPQIETLRGRLTDLVVVCTKPVSSALEAPRLWIENRRIRKLLTEMSLELARLGESSAETQRLRQLLEFSEHSGFELIAAEVVGMNPDMGVRGILIDRGRGDGVEVNQAAIVPEGLVGRIYRVGDGSAAVQLIIDHNIGVAGRLMRSRENGIIHYAGGNRLSLDGLPVTASIEAGDTVVTSGLGGIFPAGVFIGVITNVSPAPDGWLLDVEVAPGVDYGRLEELFVVRETNHTR